MQNQFKGLTPSVTAGGGHHQTRYPYGKEHRPTGRQVNLR